MNKFVNELTERINEFYKIYETYAWKQSNRKVVVSFGEKKNLSFYLFENDEPIDELQLSFDEKEENLYRAICLRTFIMIIGNVKIHKLSDDMYYNPHHKPYLLIISRDKKLCNDLDRLIEIQTNEILNFDTDIVKNSVSKVKYKKYSKKFLSELDTRIDLSREMFRKW